MELSFGTAQVHTSERMKKHPFLGKIFQGLFGYTNIGNYARFTIFKKLMNHVQLPTNAKILDLGAGFGEYSIGLAQALPNASVHALDIDKERIEAINYAIEKSELSNVNTHHSFTENLKEDAFDFIYSVDVFEHISPEEMPFKAAHRKLNTGGYLLVKIPNVRQRTILPDRFFEDHHEWLEDEHVGQVYDLAGLAKRFVSEGFELVHTSYSDGWFSRFGWELAYLGKKAGMIGQLVSLPIAKLLIRLDRMAHKGNWGNAIQVIGKKK